MRVSAIACAPGSDTSARRNLGDAFGEVGHALTARLVHVDHIGLDAGHEIAHRGKIGYHVALTHDGRARHEQIGFHNATLHSTTREETAEALAIGERTVKREWALAKAWLRVEISSRNGR